jgi:hypothetical protein
LKRPNLPAIKGSSAPEEEKEEEGEEEEEKGGGGGGEEEEDMYLDSVLLNVLPSFISTLYRFHQ